MIKPNPLYSNGVVTAEQWARAPKPGCWNKPRRDASQPVFHSKGTVSWPDVFTVECANAKFPSVQCGGCRYVMEENLKRKRVEFHKKRLALRGVR